MKTAILLALFAAAALAQGRGPQYRSKLAVYDVEARSSKIIFTADQVWEAPNWTPDGKALLVNSGGKLYTISPDGAGGPQKLEVGDQYRCNNDKAFSWDGKLLGFSASAAGGRGSQVYAAKADGSSPRLLTPAAPSYFHGWSPDNRWLAFVGQRDGKTYHLFRVSVDGGEEQQLTAAGNYDDGPEYSPDGKWIYFNSVRSGGWDIWRMPPEGAGANDAKAERVTSDELEDWFPHISPDGKRMLWLSFPKGTTGHNDRMEGTQLRIKSIPSGKIETLTTFLGGQGTINVNSWSPDSRKFAYVIYEPHQ